MLRFLYGDLYTLLSLAVPVGSKPRTELYVGRVTYTMSGKTIKLSNSFGTNVVYMSRRVVSLRADGDKVNVLLEDGSIPVITDYYWYTQVTTFIDFKQPHCLSPYLI